MKERISVLLFFLVVISLFGAAYGYLGWRIVTPAHFASPWNWLAWLIPALLVLLPFVQLLFRNAEKDGLWIDALSWVGYVSMGFFSFVLVFVLARDLVWVLAWGGEKIAGWIGPATGNPGPELVSPGRRQFLLRATNLGILGVSAALAGYGIFQARRKPELVSVEIPIPDLPPSLEGFRIAQITDIHAGLTIGREWIRTVVDEVNALGADLVAFTGDLVDGSVAQLRDDVAPMADLKAPHGVFFVTGNHEYYSGADDWLKEAENLGMTVLMNAHRTINVNGSSLVVAGVPDYSGGQFSPHHASDPASTLGSAPKDGVRILLAHQPRSVFSAQTEGFDLMLTGHTHGGQFFPWNVLAAVEQPYITGLHRHAAASGAGWVYVSQGTGYWGPPMRVGTRSEITLLTLRTVRQQETPSLLHANP